MSPHEQSAKLTSALEDYLETIFEYTQRQGFVRVKDIARVRNVKAGSVSPAMRRLSEMGLIDYERREYIRLTESGERLAREIFSRHEVLSRFFCEVLKMDREEAVKNACAMEHSLTEDAKDHLVLFMEFLLNCPFFDIVHWQRFHDQQMDITRADGCDHSCTTACVFSAMRGEGMEPLRRLSDLVPGETAVITILEGEGDERRELLNLGLIPGSSVTLSHHHPDGIHSELLINGFGLRFLRALGARVCVAGENPSTRG
ncbi:metal-dependent transcriptional regulator [Myxococcota bacterium]|nr:metal-dependent transcriptional regulator [Myxococcota bacterium]